MQYTIDNGTLSFTVDSLGAELVSVIKDGKQRVWQNQTEDWAGHGPLLFPVCGHCGVKVNGVEYPIEAHGFAKNMQFSLVKSTETTLVLAIEDSEETKKVYPFHFRFEVEYALKGSTLSIAYRIVNPAKTICISLAAGTNRLLWIAVWKITKSFLKTRKSSCIISTTTTVI